MKNVLLSLFYTAVLVWAALEMGVLTLNPSVKDRAIEMFDELRSASPAALPNSLLMNAAEETLGGKIIKVIDGDSVELRDSSGAVREIRLAEIDAPEHDQPWGSRSRRALSRKIFKKDVLVGAQGTDRYGRILGRIVFDDRDINRELVAEGYAWAYRQYLTDKSFLSDEKTARDSKLGLWSKNTTIPPWEWRHGVRRTSRPVKEIAGDFVCGAKRFCREMRSCDEARFYLLKCGMSRLDGDSDGTPCESICR